MAANQTGTESGTSRAAGKGPAAELSAKLKRRVRLATNERYVRAVARNMCRKWGENPDKIVRAGYPAVHGQNRPVEYWTLFRDDAVDAITAFVIAESERDEPEDDEPEGDNLGGDEPLNISAFLSDSRRRTP